MSFVFDPKATGLSLDNARVLVRACSVAYKDSAASRAWALANGFTEQYDAFSTCAPGQHCDTQGFIAQSPTALLVAFRGTEPHERADWLTDIQVSHESCNGIGRVHRGFHDALRSVWQDALQNGNALLPARIKAAAASGRAIWITGHSLGGALAVLCAAEAQISLGCHVQGVYTFGQPRVGDEQFAKTVDQKLGGRVFRFIAHRDIVPRVPLFSMSFRHHGCEIYFDALNARFERTDCIESVTDAIRLVSLGLTLDFSFKSLFNVLAEFKNQEHSLSDKAKVLLAAGTENIQDHNIETSYGPCLGISSEDALGAAR
jgi:triacylglycerol lipase